MGSRRRVGSAPQRLQQLHTAHPQINPFACSRAVFYARPVGEMAKWGMPCLIPSVWDFRIFVWIPEKGDCLLLVWWYTTVNGFITISRYDKSTPARVPQPPQIPPFEEVQRLGYATSAINPLMHRRPRCKSCSAHEAPCGLLSCCRAAALLNDANCPHSSQRWFVFILGSVCCAIATLHHQHAGAKECCTNCGVLEFSYQKPQKAVAEQPLAGWTVVNYTQIDWLVESDNNCRLLMGFERISYPSGWRSNCRTYRW